MLFSQFSNIGRTQFDPSSPIQPVSESRGGSTSLTEEEEKQKSTCLIQDLKKKKTLSINCHLLSVTCHLNTILCSFTFYARSQGRLLRGMIIYVKDTFGQFLAEQFKEHILGREVSISLKNKIPGGDKQTHRHGDTELVKGLIQ